jgi:GNAT superfamily N-acetyltransferase
MQSFILLNLKLYTMRLKKIFSFGNILDRETYEQLRELDYTNPNFKGCADEFQFNREWWVMLDQGEIVAYCGSIYSKGICIFNRAWVKKSHRGQGIQRRMIKTRLKAASTFCHIAITYTTLDNFPSANNLIDCRFKLYLPEYSYGGSDKLYFQKLL